jgi:hypothetical protein
MKNFNISQMESQKGSHQRTIQIQELEHQLSCNQFHIGFLYKRKSDVVSRLCTIT